MQFKYLPVVNPIHNEVEKNVAQPELIARVDDTSPGNLIDPSAAQDLGLVVGDLAALIVSNTIAGSDELVRNLSQYSQLATSEDERAADNVKAKVTTYLMLNCSSHLSACCHALWSACNRKTLFVVSLQVLYLVSAVQPMLNAWAAANRIIVGYKCDANDPECFMQWHNSLSGLVYFIAACTFYANYRIALEFMPDTLNAWWSIGKNVWSHLKQDPKYYLSPQHWDLILLAAFLLAASGATVTYQLSVESLTLFQHLIGHEIGAPLDEIMLAAAVFSTFSTRFIGCRKMLNIYHQRLLSYAYADIPLSYLEYKNEAAFYHDRRWLLTGMWEAFTNEYSMPEEMWNGFKEHVNKNEFKEAFSVLYAGQQGLLSSVAASKLGRSGYNSSLLVTYFFAVASYPIIYNIAIKAFLEWIAWPTISYFVAFASTLFYFYALGRLSDQIYRVFTMSQAFFGNAAVVRWFSVFCDIFIGAVACGNFLYSAMAQADEGKLDDWGMSRGQALIFFSLVGAIISGGCNIYADLCIGEKHAVPVRHKESIKLFEKVQAFVEKDADANTAQRSQVAAQIKKAHQQYYGSWCEMFSSEDSGNQQNEMLAPLLEVDIEGNLDSEGTERDDAFIPVNKQSWNR